MTPSQLSSLSTSPTVSTTATPTPSVTPSTPCLDGTWSWYRDDGTEGHDSCFRLGTGASTDWVIANATACPAGTHLITFGGSNKAAGLYAVVVAQYRFTDFWVGCKQSPLAQGACSMGWSWVDSTPDWHLNCGWCGEGCGLWAPGEPADCGAGYEQHCYDYCVVQHGVLKDAPRSRASINAVMCEYDVPLIGERPIAVPVCLVGLQSIILSR